MQTTMTTTTPGPAIPVNVITDEAAKMITGLVTEAKALKISDPEGFKAGAERLNQLGRSRKFVTDKVKERRAPFTKILNDISALGEPYLEGIVEAEAALNKELVAYDRMQKEEARKAEAERQRLAEVARQAKEAERLADLQRAQIVKEAEQRQAAAAGLVETATTEEGFQAGAAAFDRGIARAAEAAAVPVPVAPVEVLMAPAEVKVPQVFKATGAKGKRTAIIESLDPELLPRTYLVPDEAKIKRHILDNTITPTTPGVKFRIDEGFIGTGR